MNWTLTSVFLLLLPGCASTHVPNAKQVEGNSVMQPACLWFCWATKAVTVQEGADIRGNTGTPITIQKPLTESITQTTTETFGSQDK
jgi:hypothetical protein